MLRPLYLKGPQPTVILGPYFSKANSLIMAVFVDASRYMIDGAGSINSKTRVLSSITLSPEIELEFLL